MEFQAQAQCSGAELRLNLAPEDCLVHEAPSRATGEEKCIFINIEFILYHITSNTILLTPALNVRYHIFIYTIVYRHSHRKSY